MLLKLPGQMPQGDMGSSPAFTALAEVGRVSRDEAGRAVWALLSSITRHHFLPQELRKPAALTKAPRLSESGDNLAAVLDALVSGPDRDAINNLEKGLRESIPSIKGISLPTVEGSNPTRKELMYSLSANGKGSLVIPAQSVSEGALLLTAYLALVFGETAEVLLIEEPENGLHPERLATVIELLRKIASGAFGGHPRQVVITTHNPILLNYVEPKEVRVFQRDPEKGTFVKRMDEAPGIEKLTKTFGVGELWYMLGEKKLFDPEPAA
jgi:predicted ATPase